MGSPDYRLSVCTLFLLAACGAEEAGGGSDAAQPWLVRQPLGQSEFTPIELENAIDAIVARLNESEPRNVKVAVLSRNSGGFWQPVNTGGNRAISELGAQGLAHGVDALSDVGDDGWEKKTIDMVDAYVEQDYDGIAVAAGVDGIEDPIQRAADAGVTTITVDQDASSSARSLFIGTDNSAAGARAAETLVSAIEASTGTVIVFGSRAWESGAQRTDGAADYLRDNTPYQVRVRDFADYPENAADMGYFQEQLADADPPVVGMVGMFSHSYLLAKAVELAGKTDDVAVVTFDTEPATLSYMESGIIHATHLQRPYYYGYMSPYILYAVETLGLAEVKQILGSAIGSDAVSISAGVTVLRADRVDAYRDYTRSLNIF